ncbi:hypothetical protein [Kingella oralis]|uniref:hypothetical protein n=1 Tax=Kingella oralis TaxID=505 RepID=UPI002D805B75|nr:hypothetical protein [Kingella oralis]
MRVGRVSASRRRFIFRLPLGKAYRQPEKLSALLLPSYAVLFAALFGDEPSPLHRVFRLPEC